jgi:hypothetical protein
MRKRSKKNKTAGLKISPDKQQQKTKQVEKTDVLVLFR